MSSRWAEVTPAWALARGDSRWEFVGFDRNGAMPAKVSLCRAGWGKSRWLVGVRGIDESIDFPAPDAETAKKLCVALLRERLERVYREVTEALDQLEEAQP